MKLAANSPAIATPTLPQDATPGNAYETNFHQVMADQCREEYARTYAIVQALSRAHITGFLDITVRTSTGSVTIPFLGKGADQHAQNMYVEMAEVLGDKMSKLEADIVEYEQTSEKEEAADREGTSARAQLFGYCLPMRPLSDAEFEALPAEARRAYDEQRAERIGQPVKGGQAA